MTEAIKNGDTIQVNYTGRLDNGEVFDSSEGQPPLEFTVGSGSIIPGFDNAVVGMLPGESTTVTIPPEEAYGPLRDELFVEVSRDKFPADMSIEQGMQLQMTDPSGNTIPAVISEVLDSSIRINANHPLAGKELTFDIDIVKTL